MSDLRLYRHCKSGKIAIRIYIHDMFVMCAGLSHFVDREGTQQRASDGETRERKLIYTWASFSFQITRFTLCVLILLTMVESSMFVLDLAQALFI